jgi:HEAT repeat protein
MAHGKPVAYWLDELGRADPRARRQAVTQLGHVGTADPQVIPALAGALKDPDCTVRDVAALALLNIGPQAGDAASALDEATNDPDATVRAHAALALARVRGR